MNDKNQTVILNEIGDLGLGIQPINEQDQKALKEKEDKEKASKETK